MAEEIQEAVQIIRVAYDGIEIAMKWAVVVLLPCRRRLIS